MSLLDSLFGGFFDFNEDGHTGIGEDLIAYQFINELNREERKGQGLLVDEDDTL